MDLSFSGKRALVTGAGQGIGKVLTLKLVEYGAKVVAVSRTQSDLDKLSKISPNIETICLDVEKWNKTRNVIKDVGPIDLLVNSESISDFKEWGNLTEQEVNIILSVNTKAIMNISQVVANGMKERGTGGSIVNVSSIMAMFVAPQYGIYSASKGATDQITRSMACEFGPHNIRVNSVNPTVIRVGLSDEDGFYDFTDEFAHNMRMRTPLRRYCEVEDVVYPILFLLSDRAAMITGITMPIDGGLGICFA